MTTPSEQNLPAYQACLKEAFRQCPLMMERWCVKVCDVMYDKSLSSTIAMEKRQLQQAIAALKTSLPQLERQFLKELTDAIARDGLPAVAKKADGGRRSLSDISFDELELMGDHQVQETIDGARLQHMLLLECETELASFSARLSAARGFSRVQADKNPLRPEVVSRVLINALNALNTDAGTRALWLTHGAKLMGQEFQALYVNLDQLLMNMGVVPATYGVISASAPRGRGLAGQRHGGPPDVGVLDHAGIARDPARNPRSAGPGSMDDPASFDMGGTVSRDQLLTLDRLHRLMAGDYDESFKAEPEPSGFDFGDFPRNDFSHTVPAAMDVLAELQRSGAVAARDKNARAAPPQPVALIREHLKTEAKSLGQSVAIEVVGLMIEQLTHDSRLLAPVRQIIANAEPAFLRLAVTDPRFFSDKGHPARRLLEAMTTRSLAYSTEEADGFAGFMLDLHGVAQELTEEHATDAQHFAALLAEFEQRQDRRSFEAQAAQQRAVQALLQAEQRNLLAEKIAAEIRLRPDYSTSNPVISTFLTGPWAQVMAQERLAHEAGRAGDERSVFSLTLGDILWSVNVSETARHRKRLMRLIPDMLNSVRDGLLSIDYPLAESKDFYDELMVLHQLALKAAAAVPTLGSAHATATPGSARERLERAFEVGDHDRSSPWLAPTEAQHSGFMDFNAVTDSFGDSANDADNSLGMPDFEATRPLERTELTSRGQRDADEDSTPVQLQLGDWVELLQDTRWMRARLTWISPQKTLYMFSGEGGRSHSMTSRVLQHLLRLQLVKIISQQGVLDGALDSVARTAIRNSMEESTGFEPSGGQWR